MLQLNKAFSNTVLKVQKITKPRVISWANCHWYQVSIRFISNHIKDKSRVSSPPVIFNCASLLKRSPGTMQFQLLVGRWDYAFMWLLDSVANQGNTMATNGKQRQAGWDQKTTRRENDGRLWLDGTSIAVWIGIDPRSICNNIQNILCGLVGSSIKACICFFVLYYSWGH